MSIEEAYLAQTVNMNSQSFDWLTIHNQQDWEHLIETRMADLLTEVDQSEVDEYTMMWRSMDPGEIVNLLLLNQPAIQLQSPTHNPNASTRWREAIAHGRGNEDHPFHLALGFLPEPSRLKASKEHLGTLPADIPQMARNMRQNFFVLNGEIWPKDVRYLITRFAGEQEGKPSEPKFYRINTEVMQELLKQKEAIE